MIRRQVRTSSRTRAIRKAPTEAGAEVAGRDIKQVSTSSRSRTIKKAPPLRTGLEAMSNRRVEPVRLAHPHGVGQRKCPAAEDGAFDQLDWDISYLQGHAA